VGWGLVVQDGGYRMEGWGLFVGADTFDAVVWVVALVLLFCVVECEIRNYGPSWASMLLGQAL
jgi:hypothetical protein